MFVPTRHKNTQLQQNINIWKHNIFDFYMDLRIARIDPSRQVDMDEPKEKLDELFKNMII